MQDIKNTKNMKIDLLVNDLQEYLNSNGIETVIHYPIPPHKQTCYPNFNHYHFPITEKIHNEVISLPLSPVMLLEEFAKVVSIINEYDPAIV